MTEENISTDGNLSRKIKTRKKNQMGEKNGTSRTERFNN